MKAAWSIVIDGISKDRSKWVMVGSPGVGKSVLTVLLCFHLARRFGLRVFLARQLKDELHESQLGDTVICIDRDISAVGFPTHLKNSTVLSSICQQFGRKAYDEGFPLITVLDGWSQPEIVGDMQNFFGGFDVLATSAEYQLKGQDTRHLVMLPSWNDKDLESVWNQRMQGITADDSVSFKDQLYYSGGSARELMRPIEDVRTRIDNAIRSISARKCRSLLAGYGGSKGSASDTLRQCYLSDRSCIDSYTLSASWKFSVDSAYALNRLTLAGKAPLAVYEYALEIAKSCSRAHYGWIFEALVHKLFCLMPVTLHIERAASATVGYDSISLDQCESVECIGRNEAEAKKQLEQRRIDTVQNSYWQPDYPRFPAIDAVVCLPTAKTVLYVQITVAGVKKVDLVELTSIHKLVKKSLGKVTDTDTEGWQFKYVAIAPSLADAGRLTLKEKGTTNQIFSGHTVGDVTISKGYVSYSSSGRK
jgi:hypothetical protein